MCHGRVLPHSALIVKFGSRWLKLAIWSCSRILAGYRAGHVTYQLNISSIISMLLLISSYIEMMFSSHRKPQIVGGSIKLTGHVQGHVTTLVTCMNSICATSVLHALVAMCHYIG